MKTQMKFQKAVSLVTLITAALCCVYALIYMTDISAMAGYTSKQGTGVEAFKGVDALYELANGVTGPLFVIAIVFLLISVTLYITASNKRRNYYVTNYVSVIATAVFAVIVAVAGIIIISLCVVKYADIDHEAYLTLHNTWSNLADGSKIVSETVPTEPGNWSRLYPNYADSPAIFIIGYILNVLVLGVAGINILNLIWKTKLMKGEKALLMQGTAKEAV